ncbi:MAG TPA: alcohol dehydrogenase-like regulatory protein ErcA [Methanocella sp.]|nr:alcohol dehydrogenase-like regulatory protein ErcA [Methanocella sp.]
MVCDGVLYTNDMSWLELRKFVCPEFVFGDGALALAGRFASNFGGSKVMVVSGSNVIRAGWTGKVLKSLDDEGLPYTIFSEYTQNPKEREVMRGAEIYRSEGCDVIICVGGGSAIDCAKGIGIVNKNRSNILEFVGADQIPLPGPPLICVPTTAGSSADVSQFAIITDTRERTKTAIVSKKLVPDASLIDPSTTITMSAELTANTGIDALTHAIEAYVSNASSPITDLFALNAAQLIARHLIPAIHEPQNMEHRGKMMLGSLQAGLAFSNASLGLVHAMAHSLGGHADFPHGESNGILLPLVMKFNYQGAPDRYDQIGETMGLNLKGLDPDEKRDAIVAIVQKLQEDAGVPMVIPKGYVEKKDVQELARKAMADVCIVTNPRSVRLEDVTAIYQEALG